MAHREDHAAAIARADALTRDLARERNRAEKAERKLAAVKAKAEAEAEARAREKIAPKPPPPPPPAPSPPPFRLPIDNLADHSETGLTLSAGIIVALMLMSIAAIIAAVAYAIR